MSRFKTCQFVDIQEMKNALPKGSFVHGVKLNPESGEVILEWEHEDFKTGYTFAVDFPAETLRARGVPQGVVYVGNAATIRQEVPVAAQPVDPKPKKSKKVAQATDA